MTINCITIFRILAYGGEYRGGPVTVIEEWDGSK